MPRRRRPKRASDKVRSKALTTLQRGTYGKEGEALDWTYYDTMIVAATQIVRMFQVPLGSGGKTEDMTNLSQAGMMPQGQKLVVRAIKCFWLSQPGAGACTLVSGATIKELYTQIAKTTVKIRIENKAPMGVWTLQELMGVSCLNSIEPTVATMPYPIVSPRFHGIFPLNKPIILSALVPFYVEVTHNLTPTAVTIGDYLKIGLAGKLTRVG